MICRKKRGNKQQTTSSEKDKKGNKSHNTLYLGNDKKLNENKKFYRLNSNIGIKEKNKRRINK